METKVIIGKEYVDIVLPLVRSAKSSIKILMFDWRIYHTQPSHPMSKILLALKAAVERGVRVQVLMRSDEVRRQLCALGIDCKDLHSDKLMHAKMMLIDDQVAIVGSHNFTQGAMQSNVEISLAVDLNSPKNLLKEYFDRLFPL